MKDEYGHSYCKAKAIRPPIIFAPLGFGFIVTIRIAKDTGTIIKQKRPFIFDSNRKYNVKHKPNASRND